MSYEIKKFYSNDLRPRSFQERPERPERPDRPERPETGTHSTNLFWVVISALVHSL
jgi:hypothetical protein